MHRNLDRRVEPLVPGDGPGTAGRATGAHRPGHGRGHRSWWLARDGTWTRHHLDADGKPLRDLQSYLLERRGYLADS